jgi:hypothetical protein
VVLRWRRASGVGFSFVSPIYAEATSVPRGGADSTADERMDSLLSISTRAPCGLPWLPVQSLSMPKKPKPRTWVGSQHRLVPLALGTRPKSKRLDLVKLWRVGANDICVPPSMPVLVLLGDKSRTMVKPHVCIFPSQSVDYVQIYIRTVAFDKLVR